MPHKRTPVGQLTFDFMRTRPSVWVAAAFSAAATLVSWNFFGPIRTAPLAILFPILGAGLVWISGYVSRRHARTRVSVRRLIALVLAVMLATVCAAVLLALAIALSNYVQHEPGPRPQ